MIKLLDMVSIWFRYCLIQNAKMMTIQSIHLPQSAPELVPVFLIDLVAVHASKGSLHQFFDVYITATYVHTVPDEFLIGQKFRTDILFAWNRTKVSFRSDETDNRMKFVTIASSFTVSSCAKRFLIQSFRCFDVCDLQIDARRFLT